MKIFEKIKLIKRANKYKNKHDKGGIAYINNSIHTGDVAFDIGAHKAAYLFFMLQRVGKSGKVYAFEPQQSLYAYLENLKKSFRWDNVTLEHLALSDKAGKATLFIPINEVKQGSSPGATIVEAKGADNFGVTEIVGTESLDSYCSRKNIIPNLLKIDVEGNELNVFAGAINTLKSCKPKILVEIEERHVGREKALQTFAFLKDLGYTGFFIQGKNRMPISEFEFDIHQNTSDTKNYCNNFIFE